MFFWHITPSSNRHSYSQAHVGQNHPRSLFKLITDSHNPIDSHWFSLIILAKKSDHEGNGGFINRHKNKKSETPLWCFRNWRFCGPTNLAGPAYFQGGTCLLFVSGRGIFAGAPNQYLFWVAKRPVFFEASNLQCTPKPTTKSPGAASVLKDLLWRWLEIDSLTNKKSQFRWVFFPWIRWHNK